MGLVVAGGALILITATTELQGGATLGEALGDGVAAAGRLITTATDFISNVFRKKGEQAEIGRAIRDIYGKEANTRDARREVGDYLEAEKEAGRGGSKNDRGDFTWRELKEKVQEVLGEPGEGGHDDE